MQNARLQKCQCLQQHVPDIRPNFPLGGHRSTAHTCKGGLANALLRLSRLRPNNPQLEDHVLDVAWHVIRGRNLLGARRYPARLISIGLLIVKGPAMQTKYKLILFERFGVL